MLPLFLRLARGVVQGTALYIALSPPEPSGWIQPFAPLLSQTSWSLWAGTERKTDRAIHSSLLPALLLASVRIQTVHGSV